MKRKLENEVQSSSDQEEEIIENEQENKENSKIRHDNEWKEEKKRIAIFANLFVKKVQSEAITNKLQLSLSFGPI